MSFNNSELNRSRKNWDKERTVSERTDPDYEEKAEQRFLDELTNCTEEQIELALSGYSRKRQASIREVLKLRPKSGNTT
jgi:hypothetical protein